MFLGAYTGNSKGWIFVRQTVAEYIRQRDGLDYVDYENVYLTNGASEGVRQLFKMIIRNSNDGILVPIPQYPLYSAQIRLDDGNLIPYYLDEDKDWGIHPEDLTE